MIRFPIDLRAALMKNGLRLSPWQTEILAQPTIGELDPEILRYRFVTLHGILCFSPTIKALTVVAICNDTPGNGQFPLLMTILEETAHQAGLPMVVGSIWNTGLWRHLIEKRGYRPSKEPGCEDALIKLPGLTV